LVSESQISGLEPDQSMEIPGFRNGMTMIRNLNFAKASLLNLTNCHQLKQQLYRIFSLV